MTQTAPIDVLLVEDNEDDIFITKRSMKDTKIHVDLHVVNNGIEAMEYLRAVGDPPNRKRPDLILLDLNMPRMDGREVLQELKNDESLKTIPVVVLTSSEADEDVIKSYCLHANCFITKPVDIDAFGSIVRAIDDFWFSVVRLPRPAA